MRTNIDKKKEWKRKKNTHIFIQIKIDEIEKSFILFLQEKEHNQQKTGRGVGIREIEQIFNYLFAFFFFSMERKREEANKSLVMASFN